MTPIEAVRVLHAALDEIMEINARPEVDKIIFAARDTTFEFATASPVQGAASAPDRLQALGRRTNKEAGLNPSATSSASGAKDDNAEFARFVAWTERHNREAPGAVISPRDAWFAALADRPPAVQPTSTVQALVVGVTPGMGRIEIEFGGDVPEWADLGLRIRIATPAPEQEAAPPQSEPVAYADPMAFANFQIEREQNRGGPYTKEWMWAKPDSGLVPLYTAPVPATTPAEQPEGDSSHVVGSAKGSK